MITWITFITTVPLITANAGNVESHDLRRSGYFCNWLISKAFDWIVTVVIKVTNRIWA
jgi:hypothetical protein